jgi:hypothetical protein
MFHKAIQVNKEKTNANIVNLFYFTLCDVIFKWRENFMRLHSICKFKELEVTFYNHYWKVQKDKRVCMALCMIKQGGNEKVEVYYACISKLVNCLPHHVDNSFLTTFFKT